LGTAPLSLFPPCPEVSTTREAEAVPAGLVNLLSEPNAAFLATLMPDGSPQVTPVWVDTDGRFILVNTAAGRQKPRNVRCDPRVAWRSQTAPIPTPGRPCAAGW